MCIGGDWRFMEPTFGLLGINLGNSMCVMSFANVA